MDKRNRISFRSSVEEIKFGPEILERMIKRLQINHKYWIYKIINNEVIEKGKSTFCFRLDVVSQRRLYMSDEFLSIEYIFPRYFFIRIWNEGASKAYDILPKYQKPIEKVEEVWRDIILPRTVETMERYFWHVDPKRRTIPYHWKELWATQDIKDFIRDERGGREDNTHTETKTRNLRET